MIKTISVPAKYLAAAMLFQAKNDVRSYLCGIHLNKDGYIESTNGYILFRVEVPELRDAKLKSGMVINIQGGQIPKKAIDAVLEFNGDQGVIGFTERDPRHFDPKRMVLHSSGDGNKRPGKHISWNESPVLRAFSVVTKDYPDLDEVIPEGEFLPTQQIGLNAEYVALAGKARKILNGRSERRWSQIEIGLYGSDRTMAINLDPEKIGPNAFCYLMPCRLG